MIVNTKDDYDTPRGGNMEDRGIVRKDDLSHKISSKGGATRGLSFILIVAKQSPDHMALVPSF